MEKSKSLSQRAKELKPRFHVGKVLTKVDVKEIEAMVKRIKGLEGALRDYREQAA